MKVQKSTYKAKIKEILRHDTIKTNKNDEDFNYFWPHHPGSYDRRRGADRLDIQPAHRLSARVQGGDQRAGHIHAGARRQLRDRLNRWHRGHGGRDRDHYHYPPDLSKKKKIDRLQRDQTKPQTPLNG